MGARLALALLLAASAGCGAEPDSPTSVDELQGRAKHVLLVVIDATHAGELTCYGGLEGLTPNIDALADRGVRFDRAFSNTTWTLPSTTSLLTGLLQENHGVVTNDHRAGEELTLLPELFADAGWRTAGYVQMVYASDQYGLGQGFDEYSYIGSHDGDAPMRLAAEWMADNEGERTFTYLHIRRPHSPYDPRPKDAVEWVGPWPFDGWRPPKRVVHADVAGTRELTEEEREGAQYLYRANIATVDRQLGDLLEEWSLREDTLVVLTSDHGEGMGQHGFYGHGAKLWAEVIDIPLIFAGLGLAPQVDTGAACTVDVAPTLASLCGIPWPSARPSDGTPLSTRLLGQPDPRAERRIPISARYTTQHESGPEIGVVSGGYKLVVTPEGKSRAFDRLEDRTESAALSERDDALLEQVAELRARGLEKVHVNTTDEELPDALREELRALGYGEDEGL